MLSNLFSSNIILIAIVAFFLFGAWIITAICSGKMATRLGRSFGGWLFVAICFGSAVAILALSALGETTERRKKRILQEEEWRNAISVKSYLH